MVSASYSEIRPKQYGSGCFDQSDVHHERLQVICVSLLSLRRVFQSALSGEYCGDDI